MEPSSRGRVSETSSLVQRNGVSRPLLLPKSGAKGGKMRQLESPLHNYSQSGVLQSHVCIVGAVR